MDKCYIAHKYERNEYTGTGTVGMGGAFRPLFLCLNFEKSSRVCKLVLIMDNIMIMLGAC